MRGGILPEFTEFADIARADQKVSFGEYQI
jgi:hypothetical protein